MEHPTKISIAKQVFDELQQSEARFRAMFESSAMGVIILDLKTMTLRYNPVAQANLDDPELPETLADPYEFIHIRYREAERELFTELLNGQRDSYQTDRRYFRPGEEPTWAHLTVSSVKDSEGDLRYIVGMIENITEQKKSQQKLIESEARFRAIFEDAAIGIGILSLDRRLIDANPVLCRMYGMTREELIGQTPAIVTHPDDYSQSTDDFQEFLSGNREYYEAERRYMRKGGETFWAHVTMSFVRDTENSPLYIIGMVLDIDDKKRAQLELHQSEERFRAMFDNTAIGMTLSTLDRRVLQMNEALARITGYSLEDLKNLHPTDLTHPEDRHLGKDEFAELLDGKRNVFSLERRYFHKSGRMFWGRVTYSLVRDSNGKPYNLVGLMEDITEQKLASEKIAAQEAEYRLILEQKVEERTGELKQINQQLEEEIAQRLKAEQALAGKAAQDAILSERTRLARDLHDAVTQTLFSASLIAEVLPDLWEINPVEGEKRLEELRQLTRGALAEMRTLLVELRPNSLVQIPLPDLLRQLCESLIGRARLPIQFSAEGQAKIPADVQISFYRITQEALNNIVKHAKATKVIVTLQLGESVRLAIIDNGSGFDVDTISPDHLGLKIMCERAESIGARCSVYSQPGEGTQISVIWQSTD